MTDLIGTIEPRWTWWIAAVLLAAAEIFVPGVFLIWLAVAAMVTGLCVLLFDPPLAASLGIFALSAIASIYAGGMLYRRAARPADPLLNNRAARMVGARVTICEPIAAGEGRATDGDSYWLARGPDLPAGTIAVVAAVEGNTLLVEPL